MWSEALVTVVVERISRGSRDVIGPNEQIIEATLNASNVIHF